MSSKPGKLSKEQLRALRAQRAAALAAQQQAAPPARRTSPVGSTSSAEEDARSMPPPPPRAPSASRQQPFAQPPPQQQQQPSASFHADSQATRIHDTGGLVAHQERHGEPSINQRGSRSRGSGEEVRSTGSASRGGAGGAAAGLPAGFFEAGSAGGASVVASAAPQQQQGPAAPHSVAAEVGSQLVSERLDRAVSIEGSTGGGGGVAPSAPGTDVTSAGSRLDVAQGLSALSGVPAGFFDAAPAAADSLVGPAAAVAGGGGENDAGTVVTSPQKSGKGAQNTASLPKGFFEDKKADAKARGEVPKTQKDMTQEYAEFMKQVEVESTAAAAAQADQEEEEATGRLDREDFEQFVRMQKLQALKEAREVGAKRGVEEVDAIAAQAAQAIADPEAERPVIKLAKKRRVLDTIAALETLPEDASGSEDEVPDDLLDWRAKKSAF